MYEPTSIHISKHNLLHDLCPTWGEIINALIQYELLTFCWQGIS